MSRADLKASRDHCRRMATAKHKPDCPSLAKPETIWELAEDGTAMVWRGVRQPPKCDGCVTDSDRALWAQLADEYDAFGVAG